MRFCEQVRDYRPYNPKREGSTQEGLGVHIASYWAVGWDPAASWAGPSGRQCEPECVRIYVTVVRRNLAVVWPFFTRCGCLCTVHLARCILPDGGRLLDFPHPPDPPSQLPSCAGIPPGSDPPSQSPFLCWYSPQTHPLNSPSCAGIPPDPPSQSPFSCLFPPRTHPLNPPSGSPMEGNTGVQKLRAT